MDLSKDNISEFYRNNYESLLAYSKRMGGNEFSEDAVQDNFLWALEKINNSNTIINERSLLGHLKLESLKYTEQGKKFCCEKDLTMLIDSE